MLHEHQKQLCLQAAAVQEKSRLNAAHFVPGSHWNIERFGAFKNPNIVTAAIAVSASYVCPI